MPLEAELDALLAAVVEGRVDRLSGAGERLDALAGRLAAGGVGSACLDRIVRKARKLETRLTAAAAGIESARQTLTAIRSGGPGGTCYARDGSKVPMRTHSRGPAV